jgi:hypothetical protein
MPKPKSSGVLFGTENYKSKLSNFPTHDVSEKVKLSPQYHAAWADAIYSNYIKGLCLTSPDFVSRLSENRKYMKGEQDVLPYMGYFFGDVNMEMPQEEDFVRKALMNIDWTPVAVAVKFVNVLLNMFGEATIDMQINALDPASTRKKMKKKAQMQVKMEFRKQFEAINQEAGADVFPMEDSLPEDQQQLDFMEENGMLRLDEEEGMEAAIQEINDRCNVKDMMMEVLMDLICGGAAAIREYYDPVDHKLKKKYLDIENLVISYGEGQYVNPEYFGYLQQYTIHDLKRLTGWDDEYLRNIASQYVGYATNPSTFNREDEYWSDQVPQGNSGNIPLWYNTRVLVMEYEFLTTNYSYYTEKKLDDGKTIKYKEKYKDSGRPPRMYNTELRTTTRQGADMRMSGYWVVGTDCVFDYGYQNYQVRSTPVECGSSVHYYQLKVRKPMIDVMKPHIDGMTMVILDLRNLQAKAPGPGFYIDVDSIQELTLGAGAVSEMDIVRIGARGGAMLYKGTTGASYDYTSRNAAGAARPIEYYPGGFGPKLKELVELFEFHRRQIQELIGLPDIAVAGVNKRDTTLGEQQITYAASTNAIKHFLTAWLELEKQSAAHIIHRMKAIAKFNPEGYKVMQKALGYTAAKAFKLSESMSTMDVGIEILPIMSQGKKEMILNMAAMSKQSGEAGVGGISVMDFVKIVHLLDSGRLRAAEAYLAYRDHAEKKHRAKMQQENMQANTQGQMAAQQQKHEMEKEMAQLKSELEKQEMTHEHNLKTQGAMLGKAADASMQGALQGAAGMQQQQEAPMGV